MQPMKDCQRCRLKSSLTIRAVRGIGASPPAVGSLDPLMWRLYMSSKDGLGRRWWWALLGRSALKRRYQSVSASDHSGRASSIHLPSTRPSTSLSPLTTMHIFFFNLEHSLHLLEQANATYGFRLRQRCSEVTLAISTSVLAVFPDLAFSIGRAGWSQCAHFILPDLPLQWRGQHPCRAARRRRWWHDILARLLLHTWHPCNFSLDILTPHQSMMLYRCECY